ncbi:MAG: hypothetical protein ACRC37_05210 [Lentisphaeria bacterium]
MGRVLGVGGCIPSVGIVFSIYGIINSEFVNYVEDRSSTIYRVGGEILDHTIPANTSWTVYGHCHAKKYYKEVKYYADANEDGVAEQVETVRPEIYKDIQSSLTIEEFPLPLTY